MGITAGYAAVLGLVFVALSIRVIRLRRRYQVGLGSGANPALERAVRVHANFAEYVPFALLLLFFLESTRVAGIWVHALCLALLAGRVVHAVGVSRTEEVPYLRVIGMATTFTVILATALALLVRLGLE